MTLATQFSLTVAFNFVKGIITCYFMRSVEENIIYKKLSVVICHLIMDLIFEARHIFGDCF